MRRLALLLAASVLGTGCIVTSDDPIPLGSVIINWDFARYAPAQTADTEHASADGWIYYDEVGQGAPNSICPESDVDTVGIVPPGGAEIQVACRYLNGVQGITIDNVPEGVRRFRLLGYRGGRVVYDDTFDLEVSSIETFQHPVHVRGAYARLDVYADLVSGDAFAASCAAAGNPEIDFQIFDPVFGLVVDEGTVDCVNASSTRARVWVYSEDLDLDDYDVQLVGYQPGTSTVRYDSCLQAFSHLDADAGQSGGLIVPLYGSPLPVCQ